MKLVIVESPSKAKTIEKYLGKGYHVIASKGHIIDLPKSKIGIDVENKFAPDYEVVNKQSASNIKSNAKEATEIILAVDPDREGEAIGWHIARLLKIINDKGGIKKGSLPLKRIVFSEITKSAVEKAIENPRDIDLNLVDAQQARRVLDRLVGYKLSPLLWKKIAIGLSAGRVQSAAMRIVVKREDERNAFKSDEYWNVKLLLDEKDVRNKGIKLIYSKEDSVNEEVDLSNNIVFQLTKIAGKKANIACDKDIEKIYEDIKSKKFIITDIREKDSNLHPSPAFTTSTLQQAASNTMGFSASRTMKVAQKLYESGLITYMRTDSTAMSKEAIEKLRSFIKKDFGDGYLPDKPNFYKTKNILTQEAHEAIRPTNFELKKVGDSMANDEAKLYNLIWNRAVASQMSDAKVKNTTAEMLVDKYLFEIDGVKVLFPGYLALYKNKQKNVDLPDIKIGTELFLEQFLAQQNFTQPPARYTEATLIKEMEKNGIGRPSTYAPTISTIQQRKYVVKEGKFLVPTSIGKAVDKLLQNNFEQIVDLGFTADMENKFDDIAEGKLKWQDVIGEFYGDFAKQVKDGDKKIDKKDYVVLETVEEKCPICGKNMQKKIGRFGEFLSCIDYPECKGIMSLSKTGESSEDIQKKVDSPDFKVNYKSAPVGEDGKTYTLKFGKFGYYWAHPDYPKVKATAPLEYSDKIFAQVYGKPPKADDGKDMILRKGRFGEFWAHPDYPKVKMYKSISRKVINANKKKLGLM